ncbi:MAG: 16S rRNA (adenine(1518)-N(6)/adenine(1519)-N(6))-dimethyltransferase RsmA [Prevotellaceae bacterium]|nr:16S rRNA (adenine(1518)-N(6)/adenine(1519)-N(6))-dimethyltransferase RsmA [Prevotellaceae bacterium]
MHPVRAKKSLGQHFLNDDSIAQAIVGSLAAPTGRILEVGPGTGVLTRHLLSRPEELKLVELDREAAEYIAAAFPQTKDALVRADFLKIAPETLFDGQPFSVIGNFPYNISTQIFFKVIEHRDLIPEIAGMVQKEVAERMAATEGRKTYGILSVLLQRWYNIEYLFTVDEHVFTPPPKVKSAAVRMTRNERQDMPCDEALFVRLVKTAFNQRRKTIRNSIKLMPEAKGFEHDYLNLRPEQLSIEQFAELTNLLDAGDRL